MGLPIIAGAAVAVGWVVDKVLPKIAAAAGVIRNNIPVLEDEVVVEVLGQPGASKQQMYFLALSAANGVVRRFQPLIQPNLALPPTASVLMIEYDAADHWVRCTMRYQVSAAATNVVVSNNPQRQPPSAFMDSLAVYRGPQCSVVGGTMDYINKFLEGVPDAAQAPQLPFAGLPILTDCPKTPLGIPPPITQAPPPSELINPAVAHTSFDSPNPKPPGDNRSRGGVVTYKQSDPTPPPGFCCPKSINLVELVFAALTDPASAALEMWDSPNPGPNGLGS